MSERLFRIFPKSALGQWAVGLIVVMPIFFIIGFSFTDTIYKNVPAGRTIPADIAARPFLALTMLAGMAAGFSAFITGLLAILKQKEKGLLVYLSTMIGGLLIIFLIGEIAFPH